MAPIKDLRAPWVTGICFLIILSVILICLTIKACSSCAHCITRATHRLNTWADQTLPKPPSHSGTSSPTSYAFALVPFGGHQSRRRRQSESNDEEDPPLTPPPAPLPTHGPRANRVVMQRENTPFTTLHQSEQPPSYASVGRHVQLSRAGDPSPARYHQGRIGARRNLSDDIPELVLPGPAYQPERAFHKHIFGSI